MWQDYGALGYQPLCINLWQDMNIVKTYARQYSQQFLRDPGTVWNLYNINSSIPLNYVIDTAGIVLYGAVGWNETVIRAYIEASLPPTGVHEGNVETPLKLVSVAPSPANRPTTISFSLPKSENVAVRVYSSSGNLVRTVLDRTLNAGVSSALWDLRNNSGSRVADGMYFYEVTAGSASIRGKVSVLK
jgi:hypothetical protein